MRTMSINALPIGSAEQRPSRLYVWSVFAILFLLMVVDYVDRQVVVSMFPHLKEQWKLSDSQLGAIVSVVSLTVALGAVPLSLFADRWSRVKSIFIMVLVWSAATIACAFAHSYTGLLGARSVVGLGEAAYGTAGAALLATLFPPRMRSTILGAFFAATILGSVLGVVLGGFIADRWGWQAGFGAVGVPGILLAFVFVLVVRDYKTVALPGQEETVKPRRTARVVVNELLRPRSALITCLGAGFNLLVVSTLWAWLPSFFNRFYGLTPTQAGAKTALVVLLGGAGMLTASALADRLVKRYPNARLMVPAASAVLTTILLCAAFMGFAPGPAQYALILAGGFTMTGSVGPADAVVIDVVHAGLRATALSVLSLMRNIFGLASGPLLAGALADAYGLEHALAIIPLFCLAATVLFVVAKRFYANDVRAAENNASELATTPNAEAAVAA
jgi:predicted MFS family arabinose efflux permease